MKVLIVDDHPDVRTVLEVYCQLAGAETVTAESIEEMEAGLQGNPDVVFLDWYLGDERGGSFVDGIHETGARVVLMSGQSSGELRARCDQFGADGILTKPFTRQDISTLLEQWAVVGD